MIRQWIPDCCSGDRKCTGPKSAVANSRNRQLMTSGRSQTLATRQTMFVFPSPCNQTCCSIFNMLQLVLQHGKQSRVTIVDVQCDKGWTNVFTDSMSGEQRTHLGCWSQKKHVVQAFETCLSRPNSTAIVTPKKSNKLLRFITLSPSCREGLPPPRKLSYVQTSSVLSVLSLRRLADFCNAFLELIEHTIYVTV